jgi:hypothetical protein
VNTQNEPLNGWSFKTDNETAFRSYTDEMYTFARECAEQPSEGSALNACGATRLVWETVEGMTLADVPIDRDLLVRAIQGIVLCIKAVSAIHIPAAPRIDQHLVDMTGAMTRRRDDLSVLLHEGKMAFIRRLKTGHPAMA